MDSESAIFLQLPEGPLALMLIEHLDGEFGGESADEIEALPHGLAALQFGGEYTKGRLAPIA